MSLNEGIERRHGHAGHLNVEHPCGAFRAVQFARFPGFFSVARPVNLVTGVFEGEPGKIQNSLLVVQNKDRALHDLGYHVEVLRSPDFCGRRGLRLAHRRPRRIQPRLIRDAQHALELLVQPGRRGIAVDLAPGRWHDASRLVRLRFLLLSPFSIGRLSKPRAEHDRPVDGR
jgi:hypothetical protein